MNTFRTIQLDYDSSSSSGSGSGSSSKSPLSSIILSKKKLRINTMDDFRENTPSPPYPPKRSPIKTIYKNTYFSPKPKDVIKLIETPRHGANKLPITNTQLEKTIENLIDHLMNNIRKNDSMELDDEDNLELIKINTDFNNNPPTFNKNRNLFQNPLSKS